jgi:hypothetical protein
LSIFARAGAKRVHNSQSELEIVNWAPSRLPRIIKPRQQPTASETSALGVDRFGRISELAAFSVAEIVGQVGKIIRCVGGFDA